MKTKSEEIPTVHVIVTFSNVNFDKPHKSGSQSDDKLYPSDARLYGLNYSVLVTATLNIKVTLFPAKGGQIEKTHVMNNVNIMKIPIMVGSEACHLSGLSKQELIQVNEDPLDPFGYFILGGQEWIISLLESKPYNLITVYRNKGFQDELTRLEVLNKPGDAYENSSELRIVLLDSGGIIIELTSSQILKSVRIPFMLFLGLLGATTDKEILDNILNVSDYVNLNQIQLNIFKIASRAFKVSYDLFPDIKNIVTLTDKFDSLCKVLVEANAANKDDKEKIKIRADYNNTVFEHIDKYTLPNMGLTPEFRYQKMRYICYKIRRVITTFLKITEQTDRDDYRSKRILKAGDSYSKQIKKIFGKTVISTIKENIKKKFESGDPMQVKLETIGSGIDPSKFESGINKAINTGDKEVKVGSEVLSKNIKTTRHEKKNDINTISLHNQISTRSGGQNQAVRAYEMRAVHPSLNSIICCIQSTDTGQKVGLNKQKVLANHISVNQDSELFRQKLTQDPLIVPFHLIHSSNLDRFTLVHINGTIFGGIRNPREFLIRNRELKRGWKVKFSANTSADTHSSIVDSIEKISQNDPDVSFNNTTSVYWDMINNQFHFSLDAGRALEPCVIIRNNSDDDPVGQHIAKELGLGLYDPKTDENFHQFTLLTEKHLQDLEKGLITIDSLFEDGIIEYVACDEVPYNHSAETWELVINNKNNSLIRYDNIKIPINLVGGPALATPFASCNNTGRNTFLSNQIKQTNSAYSLAWPFRFDKKAYSQIYLQMPIVKTMINDFIIPAGLNTIVAVICYGQNQEDSLICNKSSNMRGSFAAIYSTVISEKHNGRETTMEPDASLIANSPYRFRNIDKDGFIKPGSMVKYGDALVCIVKTNSQGVSDIGSSVIYEDPTPSYIDHVVKKIQIQEKNKGYQISKIKTSSVYQVEKGDKFSSRSGQKGCNSEERHVLDMPFSPNGISPTIIISGQAFPSRMTISQIYEQILSKLCVLEGTIKDATIFTPIDVTAIIDKLEEKTFNKFGYVSMFDPITGKFINNDISLGPTYYQRLQKFAVSELNVADKAVKNIVTRQPVSVYKNGGSGKMSELFKDTAVAQGAVYTLNDKFTNDSDGTSLYICATCGNFFIHNVKTGYDNCRICEASRVHSQPTEVKSAWMTKTLIQYANLMNIGTTFKVE